MSIREDGLDYGDYGREDGDVWRSVVTVVEPAAPGVFTRAIEFGFRLEEEDAEFLSEEAEAVFEALWETADGLADPMVWAGRVTEPGRARSLFYAPDEAAGARLMAAAQRTDQAVLDVNVFDDPEWQHWARDYRIRPHDGHIFDNQGCLDLMEKGDVIHHVRPFTCVTYFPTEPYAQEFAHRLPKRHGIQAIERVDDMEEYPWGVQSTFNCGVIYRDVKMYTADIMMLLEEIPGVFVGWQTPVHTEKRWTNLLGGI